ncbi:MAG TPA: hypothetical protein VE077_05950 [Candidatus Methylomirabilis sp.]|nr:hypothetical protein [Candidatus Methylomirabilis sp.]
MNAIRVSRPLFKKTQKQLTLFLLPIACATLVLSFFSLPACAQDDSHDSGWVVLTISEYRALYAKAHPAEVEPEAPPVDATLTRVDYDLRIDGDLAAGRANLTVDVLKDGWVRVPIPPGLLVREARLDGKLVSLVPGAPGKGGSHVSALLSHSGRCVLQLDIALPVVATAGEESISLPSTASGVTKASVQLPRNGVDLRLSGGLLADKSETASESKWLAYGRGNEPLTFNWKRKTEDHRSTQALRLRGSLTELAGLGEDSTTIAAQVSVEVIQGAAKEVRIALPDKVAINSVAGALVADWEAKDGQLAVAFLEPVEQNVKFVISGERPSPRDGEIEIPILRLLNTERDTGGVAAEVLGAGEIKEFKSAGLENADASDLGELVANRQSTSLSAFRFRAGDAKSTRTLTVNVARYTPQAMLTANVAEARYNVLISNEGKTLVEARYAIRNNQRNFLKITLPAGATLWSAALAGKPIRPGQSPDNSILLPLEKSRAGQDAPEFAVEVVYLSRGAAWNEKGDFKLALPALDLPISRTGLLIYNPPLFKVTPEPGSFHVEPYEDPVSVALNPSSAPGSATYFNPSAGAPQPAPLVDADAITEYSVNGRLDKDDKEKAATQTLLDNFRATLSGGKAVGILPLAVSFPAFGPSIFMVSELTGENQSPSTNLNYSKEKKAGGR